MPEPPDFNRIPPIRTTRIRMRRLGHWRGFHVRRDRFYEGDVYRVWLGWLLVTVMHPTPAQRIR